MHSANERKPTTDAFTGMAWWNNMAEPERARWAARAGGTGVAADAWAVYKAMQYRIERPELKAAVASTKPAAQHAALLKAIRSVDGFEGAKLARIESGDRYLVRRKVVTAAGDIIHADHQQWIAAELEVDGGRVSATRARLAALDYRLTKCSVATLRVIVDRGGDQADFVQATVDQLSEAVERRLFDPAGGWMRPRDLRELVDDAEQGGEVSVSERRPIGVERYELDDVIDMASFVTAAQVIHRERATAGSRRRLKVIVDDGTSATETEMSGAELDPDWPRYSCKEQRFFDDWTASSAGRSGARAC